MSGDRAVIHDVAIVGAGFGGLGAAAECVRSGIDDFVVLERGDSLGGVWRDNVYPGAACDTQSLIYCYSYFLNLPVTRMYAGQAELLDYLDRLADEFGLRDRIRFGTEVTLAVWDEEASLWHLEWPGGGISARVLVPAWGQLGAPRIPDLPGADEFGGVRFHSAAWPEDFDATGLRVASIGNAASAVQYVPELARAARQLVVFQRSPNYILPRGQVVFSADESARFQREPDSFRAVRAEIHRMREEGLSRIQLGTGAQEAGREEALQHLERQIADPELRALLTPQYEFGCKRILRSDDYYPALAQSNVTLETAAIARLTPGGIETVDGIHHPFDAIVYGTGFDSQAFNGRMRVIGRNGTSLDERWREAPEAYLGMVVDGFPNMFVVYGPNTNLNHNSVVTMLETQHDYIVRAVQRIRDDGDVLDVRRAVLDDYNDWLQQELERSAFSADCSSWYKNAAGRVVNNWCGSVDDYRRATAEVERGDYLALA